MMKYLRTKLGNRLEITTIPYLTTTVAAIKNSGITSVGCYA